MIQASVSGAGPILLHLHDVGLQSPVLCGQALVCVAHILQLHLTHTSLVHVKRPAEGAADFQVSRSAIASANVLGECMGNSVPTQLCRVFNQRTQQDHAGLSTCSPGFVRLTAHALAQMPSPEACCVLAPMMPVQHSQPVHSRHNTSMYLQFITCHPCCWGSQGG